ncbi:MAG: hypothetical protein ACKVVT_01010 [Dehalococcoidia bacterium]
MPDPNLFTMLSAYRPGSPATPFETYCTTGLAYFLRRGHRMLTALIGAAAGAQGEAIAIVEVQPEVAGAGIADLVLTFEGGVRALVEVQVESGADARLLPALEAAGASWSPPAVLVRLGLDGDERAQPGWRPVRWLDVVEALEDDPDPLAQQYTEFILRDVLGKGAVPLEEAIITNRLYAAGADAVRRRFGDHARYQNSASPPIRGRYRYLGTTFSPDGGGMDYWLGLVNETVPLGEHYHLMLAAKSTPMLPRAQQPRATADWKWQFWSGLGRVVRPMAPQDFDELLGRLELP